MNIRRANYKDLEGIQELLKESGLNDQEVAEHLQHFLVIESSSEEKQILGVAGMEVYPPYALLRSFVLKRGIWKPEIGLELIQMLLIHAEKLKCDSVFLIASALTPLFESMGFTKITEKVLPQPIKASAHFKSSIKHGVPMVYHCLHKRQLEVIPVKES